MQVPLWMEDHLGNVSLKQCVQQIRHQTASLPVSISAKERSLKQQYLTASLPYSLACSEIGNATASQHRIRVRAIDVSDIQ